MSSTLREVSLCAPPSFVFIYDMAIDPLPKDAAAAANSLQSCPTLCNPLDGSPPGSPVPGILQARTLERLVLTKYPQQICSVGDQYNYGYK